MNLIVFGEDSFTSIVVESLVKKGHNILGVFCPLYENKIHARLETTCNNYHISFKRVSEINSDSFYEQIREIQIDLIIICHFKKLISAKIINLPKLGCINLHPSLLPYYRGMSPQHFPIIKGESETGVTIHFVDEGIDTGPLIEHESLPLDLDKDYLNQLLALYQSAVPRLARIIEQREAACVLRRLPNGDTTGGYYSTPTASDCAQFSGLGLRLF